jgi:hypothetical protein
MARDVPFSSSQGLVVLSWRSGDEGVFFTVRGEGEEVRLLCVCGRCHWIVQERSDSEGAHVGVTCHNCGRRQTFVLGGAELPSS